MSRVVITHGSLTGKQRARRRYRCDGHLADERHFIEEGAEYVAQALPPDHPEIGNLGWWHARYCMECCPAEFVDGGAR